MKIIAEIGNSHEGSKHLAKRFADAAINSGADIIKFQVHIFDEESLPNAPSPAYFKEESRKSYLTRTSFTIEDWMEIKTHIKEKGATFMASVFSIKSAELLLGINENMVKVPSGEVTNIPLLKYLNKNFERVILSSGMSTYEEITKAIDVLSDVELVLMQCTSEYPCLPENSGLNVLNEFKSRFGSNVILGYSDHTTGISVALGARAIGALWFEKHFTLSKWMYGSDAWNAVEPNEFSTYCNSLRELDIALSNTVDKDEIALQLSEMRMTFQKSIVFAKDLKKGHVLTLNDFCFKKPDEGISASYYEDYLGKQLNTDVKKNEYLKRSDVI